MRDDGVLHGIVHAVFEDVEREVGDHRLSDPLAGLDGILGPDGGARRKNFYEGEVFAVALNFERFADGLARLHDVLVVGEGDALDIDGSFELGNQLGHVQREAFVDGTASEGGRGALLADEGCGGHLAAGHSVDGVVDEEYGDMFAAVGGVDDFGGADGGEVAVALIGNDDAVGTGALDAGGTGGCAAVRELDVAHVDIVIGEDGTADGADEDGPVL